MRRFQLAPVLLLLASTALAQAPASQPIAGKTLGVFFALSVADVDAMSAWYRDKLGFRIASHGEAPNKIAKFALLEAGDSILEMIQRSDAKPLSKAVPGAKGAYALQEQLDKGDRIQPQAARPKPQVLGKLHGLGPGESASAGDPGPRSRPRPASCSGQSPVFGSARSDPGAGTSLSRCPCCCFIS